MCLLCLDVFIVLILCYASVLRLPIRLLFYVIKPQKYRNKNWLQCLFFVKVANLKRQISKFYLQILNTVHL